MQEVKYVPPREGPFGGTNGHAEDTSGKWFWRENSLGHYKSQAKYPAKRSVDVRRFKADDGEEIIIALVVDRKGWKQKSEKAYRISGRREFDNKIALADAPAPVTWGPFFE